MSVDAEVHVLGSVLLDNDVLTVLAGSLQPKHFKLEANRTIYQSMQRLSGNGKPIDLVTLTEDLRQHDELEAVGNVPYLIGLMDIVPTAAYAERYAKTLLNGDSAVAS